MVLRSFQRTPLVAVAAVLSIGLGIGANTAIYSLLDQMLLRLMPVKEPKRLVVLKGNGPNNGRTWDDGTHTSFSYPLYRDIAASQAKVFSGVLARFQTAATIGHQGVTERVTAELVSGNYFDVLGVTAAIGRTLTPQDDVTPGGHPVAVLSYSTFENRFGGNAAILNQTIQVNGRAMTVVGVARKGFGGFQSGVVADVFVPMMMVPVIAPDWQDLKNRRWQWLQMVARLQPGISREQAQVALNTFYKPVLEEELKEIPARSERFRREFLGKTITLVDGATGHSALRQQFSTPLIALMAMVGLVLLIACANVANLLLSRAAGRQKEIGIRLSLGATRWRLMRQLIGESLTLSIAGGLLGVVLAAWATQALLAMMPGQDQLRGYEGGLNWQVLAFGGALSIATGLLFGLAPAIQAMRPDLATTLKDQASSTTGGAAHVFLRKALVVGQVALSLVLLIGAGLFARSLYNLRTLDVGYKTDHVMTFSIDPSLNAYGMTQVFQAYERIQGAISRLPGVRSVSMSAMPLLGGAYMGFGLSVPGYKPKEGEDMGTLVNLTGPGYLASVGLPLLNGRDVQDRDRSGAPRVAVVNDTLVKKYFNGESPLGRHLQLMTGRDELDVEVVGVVRDFKHGDYRDEKRAFVFLPYQQFIRPLAATFYVRTQRDPAAMGETLARVVRDVDANLPVYDLKTLERQASESLFVDRAVATLASAFGLLATLLAAIGLYGVMAYSVAQRTREIGIRVALGANASRVRRMVLGQVGGLVAIGVAIAVPIAVLLSRFVKSQLYGLTGNDPAIIAGAAVLIAGVSLLAGLIPANRAVRIDPIAALRWE